MEIWKEIKGYEGLYEISSLGNVKSIRRNKLLSLRIDQGGYKACTLCAITKKAVKVHRLVYEAFIGELDNSLVIDHIDAIKINNEASNLRQIPTRENTTLGKNRASNLRGVRLFKPNNKWGAEIQIEGVRYFLGLYNSSELASEQYEKALSGWLNFKIKPARIKEGFKICRACNCELPISEFNPIKTMKGTLSLMYQCKDCERKSKKVRYERKKQLKITDILNKH